VSGAKSLASDLSNDRSETDFLRTVKKSYRSVHAPWQVVEFGTEIEIMNRNDNSAPSDIGKAAERRLTRFDYVDGGVVTGVG
jgi:hypothetical protein